MAATENANEVHSKEAVKRTKCTKLVHYAHFHNTMDVQMLHDQEFFLWPDGRRPRGDLLVTLITLAGITPIKICW